MCSCLKQLRSLDRLSTLQGMRYSTQKGVREGWCLSNIYWSRTESYDNVKLTFFSKLPVCLLKVNKLQFSWSFVLWLVYAVMTDASKSCWTFLHSKRRNEYNYPRVTHRFHSLFELSLVMHGEEGVEEGGCFRMKFIQPQNLNICMTIKRFWEKQQSNKKKNRKRQAKSH